MSTSELEMPKADKRETRIGHWMKKLAFDGNKLRGYETDERSAGDLSFCEERPGVAKMWMGLR